MVQRMIVSQNKGTPEKVPPNFGKPPYANFTKAESYLTKRLGNRFCGWGSHTSELCWKFNDYQHEVFEPQEL